MTKQCQQCGVTFTQARPNGSIPKFCSRACFNDSRRPTFVDLTCLVCGKVFSRNRSHVNDSTKCCSHACSRRYARSKAVYPDRVKKSCEFCGVEYQTVRSNADRRRYCSYACRDKAWQAAPSDFWAKVHIGKADECWPCKDTTGVFIDVHGYGHVGFQGRREATHRLAWALTNGPIPDGLIVCHHCDNPSCCNPSHLFIGTDKDNAHDRNKKMRHAYGERNPNSKLTNVNVRQILDLRAAGKTTYEIAGIFGVSRPVVGLIVNNKAWKHVERTQA